MAYFLLGAVVALITCLLVSRLILASRTRTVHTERIVRTIERGAEGFRQTARGRH